MTGNLRTNVAHRKAISITYADCVFVALVSSPVLLSTVASLALHMLSH
jgi:hypothetical protein